MQALANKTAELGDVAGPKALEWANEFETSLNRLKVALEGVAMRAGQNMIPKMPGWIDAATKAISPAPSDSTPSTPRYPRGGTKPPPGFFDDAIAWWQDFDARARAASPRASHNAPATAPGARAPGAAPASSAPSGQGPADPLFDVATRRLIGPRDIAREREAFQQGQSASQQSVRVDINFNNRPDGVHTKVTSSSPAVQTRIGGTMDAGGRQ
jgi:hypothetical protein